jgi:5'-methylthioadenosine phosphorylase
MSKTPLFAVIGGSGLYQIPGLTQIKEHQIDTPFGEPSGPITEGVLGGARIFFLSRHGIGHFINPSEVNYRANIYALKSLDVNRVISVNACGSLREDFQPGDLVIPDQILDMTKSRENTFFQNGLTAHISVADPFCKDLSVILSEALNQGGATVHQGGSFVIIEGPRFSTRSESNTYRSWGMSIIGMTSAPEAFLAREAEMCYASIAHITDYDVWHTREDPVSVEMVLKVLKSNTDHVKEALIWLVENPPDVTRGCDCLDALAGAIITNPKAVPKETRQQLDLLVSKYLEDKF